jgi:hypothetical protein
MPRFIFRWDIRGAHTHIRVFVRWRDVTPALCGELIMRNEEFEAFQVSNRKTFVFIDDRE